MAIGTLQLWITQGAPRKTAKGWPIEAIREWRAATLQPPKEAREVPASPEDAQRLLKAQADEREAKAELVRLKVAIERGEYRALKEIEDWDRARCSVLRRGLLAFERSLPPALVGLDERQMSAVVKTKVRELFRRYRKL